MTSALLVGRASTKVSAAISKGLLVRPDTCEACGDKPAPKIYKCFCGTIERTQIEAHHYNGHHNALDVMFVCHDCNSLLRGDEFHSGILGKAETILYIRFCKSQP